MADIPCKGKNYHELTQSSNASLTRETKSTRLNGTTFVIGCTGLQDKKNRKPMSKLSVFKGY